MVWKVFLLGYYSINKKHKKQKENKIPRQTLKQQEQNLKQYSTFLRRFNSIKLNVVSNIFRIVTTCIL